MLGMFIDEIFMSLIASMQTSALIYSLGAIN